MHTRIYRRQFLRHSAMTAVGVMAGACAKPTATPEPTPAQVATAAPAAATAAPPAETPSLPQEIDSLEPPWPWQAETASDSSDLPVWKGKQLKLRYWYAHGTSYDAKLQTSAQDVVSPEVARVAGITIDDENSFDNAGQTADVKLGMLAAANDWPHLILFASMSGGIGPLAEAGKVYDLTDLIPKYMPTLMKKVPPSAQARWKANVRVSYKGRLYAVPFGVGGTPLSVQDPTMDKSKAAVFDTPREPTGFPIWVRDDILKKLYPQAKSQQEIVDLYMQKGQFSKEDVFDVPIKSAEDFFKLLYDIKELGIKEGGQEVYPFYVSCGLDNWALMVYLGGWLFGRTSDTYYFSYWDNQSKRIEYTFKQPFFREELKRWNQLVRDGVAAKESLIDTNAIFTEKLNQGLYATSYAWLKPNNQLLEQQGKPYRYRKVYLDIPIQRRFNAYADFPGTVWDIGIFKDTVSQEELIQILRWLDYTASDAGEKLSCWGPRNAGLWEERDGKRFLKDQELEEYMVYGKESPVGVRYNLNNGLVGDRATGNGGWLPAFTWGNRSKFHPAVTYDRKRNPNEAEQFFSSGIVLPPLKEVVSDRPANIWEFAKYVPEVERAWKARQSFEDALLKTLTATNDAEFDKLYKDLLTLADSIGYTDKTLEEINRVFREEVNAEYMDNLLAAGG